GEDRAGPGPVHQQHVRGRHAGAGDLLDGDDLGEQVGAGTAEVLGVGEAGEVGLDDRLPRLGGEAFLLVDGGGVRRDPLGGDLPDDLAELRVDVLGGAGHDGTTPSAGGVVVCSVIGGQERSPPAPGRAVIRPHSSGTSPNPGSTSAVSPAVGVGPGSGAVRDSRGTAGTRVRSKPGCRDAMCGCAASSCGSRTGVTQASLSAKWAAQVSRSFVRKAASSVRASESHRSGARWSGTPFSSSSPSP